MERNLRLIAAYDGGAYAGWQIQPNVPTVQGKIEAVLAQMTQRPVRLRAAGRTDAGVHAEGQVASFRTPSTISSERFRKGLNALLPDDIAIREVADVDADFDARRHNRGKHYRYTIWRAPVSPPEARARTLHVYSRLDLGAMATAASKLVGTHDFAAFRSAACERDTTVRTLYRCTVDDHWPELRIDVEGTAFLKNMVRIISGTLLEIGNGRLPGSIIERMLASGDRTIGGRTVPAAGLCLRRVFVHQASQPPAPVVDLERDGGACE